jgi:hypothetical protein
MSACLPLCDGAFYALEAFTSLPLSKHPWGEVLSLLPSPASFFTHSSSGDCSSPSLWSSGHPTLSGKYLFFFFQLLVYYSDWFFPLFSPWVGVILSMGLCWFTLCPLDHLVVCIFPSCLGASVWQHRSLPGFSISRGVGMLCMGWRCGGVGVLPLLDGFSYKVYLQHLSKTLL